MDVARSSCPFSADPDRPIGSRFWPPARCSTNDASSGNSSASSTKTVSRSRSIGRTARRLVLSSVSRLSPQWASCRETASWMALRYPRYSAPREPTRTKSPLLSVRAAARAGASIIPAILSGAAGVIPSQSHPRLMTLPKVLTARPRWSSGNENSLRAKYPIATGLRFRCRQTASFDTSAPTTC